MESVCSVNNEILAGEQEGKEKTDNLLFKKRAPFEHVLQHSGKQHRHNENECKKMFF